MTIEENLRKEIDWHNPPMTNVIVNGEPMPATILYTDEDGNEQVLSYKLSEEKQKIVDSLAYSVKPKFAGPIDCSPEERFYADFLLANRITLTNRQRVHNTVLKRVNEWREENLGDYKALYAKKPLRRASLARRIYKRIIKWLKG